MGTMAHPLVIILIVLWSPAVRGSAPAMLVVVVTVV